MEKGLFCSVKYLLVSGVLIFVAFGLQASQPYQPEIAIPLTESWRWKHFSELEGKGIRFITETSDQRVWVSCNEGVLEYDGYNWKQHNAENGLTASPVDQLLVAEDGSIYGTTSKGIFQYNGTDWSSFFKVPNDVNFTFYQIKQLSDNSIIACADRGFVHFTANGSIDFFTSKPKIEKLRNHFPKVNWIELPATALNDAGDFIYASDVLEVQDGTMWFALSPQMEVGKLLRFRKTKNPTQQMLEAEVIESTPKVQFGEGQKLLLDKQGNIWVINSTSNKGISIFDGSKWKAIHLNEKFGGDEYMADIVQTDNGTIWISSMAKIYAFEKGKWELYKAPAFPIPANRIILSNCQNDQLWVAGYKSRALLLDYSTDKWMTYNGLSFQCEDSPDNQWFLEVNNRVVHHHANGWISYGPEDGLMDAPIRIIKTSQGQVWAAGSHQGIAATALFKDGTWERHIHRKLSWGIDYRSVFEASDGTLWFGGSVDAEKKDGFYSGVLQLPDPLAKNPEWIHHPFQENGLGQANVYGIGESKDGRIWIGGSRLLYYDGESWKGVADERLQQYVNTIYSTDELLLVGSRYYGMFIFDGNEWKNYDTSDGLSGNTIISIDALSNSEFLVATENDICKFDGISWTQNIFPEKLNMDFEGGTLCHTDQNTIWVNHVPRSWKRRAYQQTIMGHLEEWSDFFTTRYKPSTTPPETDFGLYLEDISPEGNSLISWTGKDFFANTPINELTYSYRMDDEEWSPFSKETHHTFTSLPSGKHKLEVRARDRDFNVDPTPAMIEFEVLPPIWKQAWFILLILTFLIIFGIYEYRVLTKKRKLEILNSSLQNANLKLKERGRKIELQNEEILAQQEQILEQAKILEGNNKDLEERNQEIRQQRDQLEDMIEQVENLSKAKLAFFTNISHELRTPLTLILGPVMQLQKEGDQLSTAERNQLHDTIQNNASRLLKLINQLLEMRRIEHNSLELKQHDIHLPDYINLVTDLFENLAIKRNILLDFTDKSENPLVAMDPDKVEKVMVNLLSNAFKHTPEGGSITVGLKTISASERGLNSFYDKYFEIVVEDTGAGISQEKIDFIFEKYYTSESDLMYTDNSGIGLSYVKDLIYLMQGEIRVESQLNKGTKFMVYLPVIPVKDKTAIDHSNHQLEVARQEVSILLKNYEQYYENELTKGGEPTTVQPRILVVEDNREMLQFLTSILKKKYQILTAENGREGLKVAKNQEVDLIISDVMMPEMDGMLFCEKIKKNFATSHIPVILLTAKVLEENKLSGFLKGADDYITKPFNPDLLLVRIENLLKLRKKLRDIFVKDFMLTPKVEEVISPDREFLQKLVDIMNENLSDADFNVDKMCKMVFLSHMHFIRKVKQLTGKKPIDLLKSFRMKKAKELLAQKKLTIAEVAYKVGFDLPNSFSRSFKKEFGISPTEFMNELPDLPRKKNKLEDSLSGD